jgi:polysaccharide export outer membrane protein
MTTQEIEAMLKTRLKPFLKDPAITVSLAQSRGVQQVRGEHLVRPDGTVSLGNYGSVYVAGLTLPQVKAAIEQHLSKYLLKPEVSVDVFAYNSKYYYVITDFAGSGEQVVRLPSTGNETVLDAISMIGGLSAVSSKNLWVARPAPAGSSCGDQILPIDWRGITRRGQTKINYQVLPGDRVFVMSQPLTKLDNSIARATAPLERLLGTTLFGYTTVRTLETGGQFGLGGQSSTTVNVAR